MNWLNGKKTYIIATLMVLVSLVKLITGDMTFADFFSSNDINVLLQALGISALRSGISNSAAVAAK